jgi:glycine cleavage system H lipoate-binding protein
MKITKKLAQFIEHFNDSDQMLVVETKAQTLRGTVVEYCLENPGSDTRHGRVVGTVGAVKAAIDAQR